MSEMEELLARLRQAKVTATATQQRLDKEHEQAKAALRVANTDVQRISQLIEEVESYIDWFGRQEATS